MVPLLPFKYTGAVEDKDETNKNQSSINKIKGMNVLCTDLALKAKWQIKIYRQYEEI